MTPSFSINIKGRRADSYESTYEKENIKITCSVLFYDISISQNYVQIVLKL